MSDHVRAGGLDPETALDAIRDIATEAVNEHETPKRRLEMIRKLCDAALASGIVVNVTPAPTEPAGSFSAGLAAGYEEGRRRGR